MWGIRGFKAGRQLEISFEKMTEDMAEARKQGQPDPEAIRAQAEVERMQAETKAKGQELALRQQESTTQLQLEVRRMMLEQQFKFEQLEIDRERLDLERARQAMEAEQYQPAPDTTAHDEHMRRMESMRTVSEVQSRARELDQRERELSLKVAAHNRDLVAEEEAEVPEGETAPEPSVVTTLSAQIAEALTVSTQTLARHMTELQEMAIERQDELMRRMDERQREQMQQVAALLSAPKRVVRDGDGRAVGIEVGPSTDTVQ